MTTVRLGMVLVALALAGCGDDATTPSPDDDGGDVALPEVSVTLPIDFSGVAVTWAPCPLYDVPSPSGEAECADVALPMFYDDDPRTLTVRVKRRLSDTQPAVAQLWFMAGGPGSAATRTRPALMEAFATLAGLGIDAYAVDHRGTGGSSLLACPGVQDPESPGGGGLALEEVPDCAAHLEQTVGDAMLAYAETYSAIDLMAMITAEDRDQRVFLTGGSGGTILGQRFLSLFPDGADGVILEAINPPDRSIVDWADAHRDAMSQLLDVSCASDPACGPRLDGQPFAVWETLMVDLEAGACPAVTDDFGAEAVERLLSNQLLFTEGQAWLVPAMIHRLRRCAPDDVDAFFFLVEAASILSVDAAEPIEFSHTLLRHISFSELVFNEQFPDFAAIDAYAAQQRLFGAELARSAGQGRQQWLAVAYDDPVYDDAWATSSVPILMLQGAIDPLTPATGARRVGEHFAAANQQYVEFPHTSHTFTNVTVPGAGGMVDCRFSMWLAFLQAEGAPIDTSCVALTTPLDFDPPPTVVQPLLGRDDAWE